GLHEPFEKYMRGGEHGGEAIGFYVSGSTVEDYLHFDTTENKRYNNFNEYMTTEANYTSTHFVSDDTMSSLTSNSDYVHPNKYDVTQTEPEHLGFGKYKSYYISNDNGRKLGIHLDTYMIKSLKMYTDSSYNPIVAKFDGDNSVLKDNGRELIPRAIANAAGFVNYFFRGRMEATMTPCSLTIKNVSKVDYVASSETVTFKEEGAFGVYVELPNKMVHLVTKLPLDKNLDVNQSVSFGGVKQKLQTLLKEQNLPLDDSYPLTVIYDGDIGTERGISVKKFESTMQEEEPTPEPTRGEVEVILSWSDPSVDLDLELDMPQSIRDVQACTMEHAYVTSGFEIYPGHYPVNVTKISEREMVEKYFVTIITPDEIKVLEIDANTIGHIADIVVRYINNQPVIDLEIEPTVNLVFRSPRPRPIGGSGSGGGRSYTPSSYRYTDIPSPIASPCSPAKSCGCMDCEYMVVPYIGQVIKGPLSGADISLSSAEGYRNDTALYSGKTSEGIKLYTAGLLNIPAELIETLDDDGLYIIKVSGGMDIDRNDDMKVDNVFTENYATLHAVLSGADLKSIKPKVSILTEIAYQIIHDSLISGEEEQKIFDTLDDVAKRLLRVKIYPTSSGGLSHIDLAHWLPTLDREILFANYDNRIVPIVDKLQDNQDIYQDAYDLVYYPESIIPMIQSSLFNVEEHTELNTVIGKAKVLNEGASPITNFILSGSDADLFDIDSNGTISVKTELDYEMQQRYTIYVRAQNSQGYSESTAIYIQVKDILDAPVITSFSAPVLYSSLPEGTNIGKLSFDPGTAPVSTIEVNGRDSIYFEIDLEGNIILSRTLENYLVKKVYHIEVAVVNGHGSSRLASIEFNVSDRQELPIIKGFDADITENTTEVFIGKVEVLNTGLSDVDYFGLSGSEYFRINNMGEVYITQNADIDFEKQQQYRLNVWAHNSYGDSKNVVVAIKVNNIPDTPPTTYNSYDLSIDENSQMGLTVGSVRLDEGEAPVDSVTVTGIDGALFSIDRSGVVHVNGNLDYEKDKSHLLHYTATSLLGTSNESNLTIHIKNIPEYVPTLRSISVTRHLYELFMENSIGMILVDSGDTPIENIKLSPDSPFGVHNDGTVFLTSE
ncbi:MAG: hypothetical protein DRG30_08370, partial [Epsilonproteobacteria bacterium]